MFYQTSFKRSRPFWLLIGTRKLLCFSAQLEGSRPWSRFVCSYLTQHNNGHSMRWNSFCWGMPLCKWWQEVFTDAKDEEEYEISETGSSDFSSEFSEQEESPITSVPGRRRKKSTKKQTTKKPRGKQATDKRGKVRAKKNKFLTKNGTGWVCW